MTQDSGVFSDAPIVPILADEEGVAPAFEAAEEALVVDVEEDAPVVVEEEEPAVEEEPEADDDEEEPEVLFRRELRVLPGDWFVIHSYAGFEKRVKSNIEKGWPPSSCLTRATITFGEVPTSVTMPPSSEAKAIGIRKTEGEVPPRRAS